MRSWMICLCAALLATAPLRAYEALPQPQIAIDMTIMTGPARVSNHVNDVLSKYGNSAGSNRVVVMPAAEAASLMQACRDKHGAKLLSQPKLVTSDEQAARLQVAGEHPIRTANGEMSRDGITVGVLPKICPGGGLHLTVSSQLVKLHKSHGVQKATGPTPLGSVSDISSAREVQAGQTMLIVAPLADEVTLIAVTPRLFDEPPPSPVPGQVQLDVCVLKASRDAMQRPGIKDLVHKLGDGKNTSFAVSSAETVTRLFGCCLTEAGAKLIAEPKLVTLNGRPCRFLSGGQQTLKNGVHGVVDRHVGVEIGFLPTLRDDGSIHLEMNPVLRAVKSGVDEQSFRVAATVKPGETLLCCTPDGGGVTLIAVTPKVLTPPAVLKVAPPAAAPRTSVVAMKLVAKYREACAKGDMESAREFAQMALDLDPACFAKTPNAAKADEPNARMEGLIHGSDHHGPPRIPKEPRPATDQPSHLTPERVHGGIQ